MLRNAFENMATESSLQEVSDRVDILAKETTAAGISTKLDSLATEETSSEISNKLDAVSTEATVQSISSKLDYPEDNFLRRIIMKALARLTFSISGLRVDASGSTVTASIASSQTLTTVTTVGNANNVAIGRISADGTGIQMSYLAFQQGFRKNLTIS